eukprot:5704452-Prymnesium_polylepis.1
MPRSAAIWPLGLTVTVVSDRDSSRFADTCDDDDHARPRQIQLRLTLRAESVDHWPKKLDHWLGCVCWKLLQTTPREVFLVYRLVFWCKARLPGYSLLPVETGVGFSATAASCLRPTGGRRNYREVAANARVWAEPKRRSAEDKEVQTVYLWQNAGRQSAFWPAIG